MLDVCLLGTGGMMPLPYRRLTACMTRFQGHSLLIDCGEGTQVGIKERGWSVKPLDAICFTHFHADHISGLPGLLLTLGNAERTEPLLIIGPRGVEKVVNSLRVIAPELPFPIRFYELKEKEHRIEMDGYAIEAFQVRHNVICYGYSITIPRAGKFDPEKAKENQISMKYWNRLQKGETLEDETGRILTSDMILGAPRKGIRLTYCTDTRPVQAIVKHAQEADLFICEGMYGEDGKEKKAREYKHMTFYEAARLAKNANVKRLWLTHYSPSLVRPEEFMGKVRKIFPNALPGKDGKTITLDFQEEEK
ncbi:MAG TPA: ribonuclease Z [Candidatus Anaerostipes excrementavium]|uniref:Ribonuclease Z n=1 Tax=Candidatus Anaerostipes excrementavium TaxID=2838463 RepID=A0A9D1WVE8_9FIRM|nr:ribonuclease Z [uncultured Anaerostipes sp.]HIX67848.1 ribonuclease Z [Candidatus Anaerostipes excrementavium]